MFNFSAYSNFVSGEGLPLLPAAPGSLELYMAGQDQVRLIWDNVSNNESGFTIERAEHYPWGPMQWLKVTATDVTMADETLPDPTRFYAYRVRADNAAGHSGWAEAGPITGIALKSVTFSQTAGSPGLSMVNIERDNGNGAYVGPHWLDSNLNGQIDAGVAPVFINGTIENKNGTPADPTDDELRFPIAYVRSTPGAPVTMQVDLDVFFGGTVNTDWQVRGTGGGFTFTLVGNITEGGSGISATFVADAPLGETIDSRMLRINWEVSLNAGGNWFSAGRSANWLYVTGSTTEDEASETVLHLGGEGAKDCGRGMSEMIREMPSTTIGRW
jgi:hypothetical protein